MEQRPNPPMDLQERIAQLEHWVQAVRRKMEGLIVENNRLREVVRIAEEELHNRREQVRRLEEENAQLRRSRAEARTKVSQAVRRLDDLMAEKEEQP